MPRLLSRTGSAALLFTLSSFAATDLRLLDAVKSRDHKAVTRLLAAKVNVNAAQPDGATALAWAAYLDDEETAAKLLAAGAKPNTAPMKIILYVSFDGHASHPDFVPD